MQPTQIVPFQDRVKNGIRILLDKEDPLGKETFPSRSMEVGAILHWAEENQIALKSEFYLKAGDPPEIVTYDYYPQMDQMPIRETAPKQVTTIPQ